MGTASEEKSTLLSSNIVFIITISSRCSGTDNYQLIKWHVCSNTVWFTQRIDTQQALHSTSSNNAQMQYTIQCNDHPRYWLVLFHSCSRPFILVLALLVLICDTVKFSPFVLRAEWTSCIKIVQDNALQTLNLQLLQFEIMATQRWRKPKIARKC